MFGGLEMLHIMVFKTRLERSGSPLYFLSGYELTNWWWFVKYIMRFKKKNLQVNNRNEINRKKRKIENHIKDNIKNLCGSLRPWPPSWWQVENYINKYGVRGFFFFFWREKGYYLDLIFWYIWRLIKIF